MTYCTVPVEVLEDSLAEFPGALVIVSHDRDLLDRICTGVVGLDGRGGTAPYGSVGQWLSAYERTVAERAEPHTRRAYERARGRGTLLARDTTDLARGGSKWAR